MCLGVSVYVAYPKGPTLSLSDLINFDVFCRIQYLKGTVGSQKHTHTHTLVLLLRTNFTPSG